MAQVVVEMTGDEAKLWQALDRVAKKSQQTEQQFQKTGRKGKESGKDVARAFATDAVKSMTAALVGAGGLAAAVGLLKGEYAEMIRLQDKALQKQTTAHQARQSLIRNMSGQDEATIQQTLGTARAIANSTGVQEKFVTQALASAVSASGGNVPASIAAVRQSSQFLADSPEAIAGYAGSLLDLSKVTGTSDAEVNMGLLNQVGAMSRVVDPRQQAKNIPRALIGQQAFGASGQGAAALYAALTTGSGDIEGATSATGAISLAEQLRGAVPELGTMTERIQALQANPARAQQFLQKASFEKTVMGPIEQLLTNPQSATAQAFAKNLGAMPDQAGLAQIAQQSLAMRDVDPLEQAQNIRRQGQALAGDTFLQNVRSGQGGAIREAVFGDDGLLAASGESKFARWVQTKRYDTRGLRGEGNTESALMALEDRQMELYRDYRSGTMTPEETAQTADMLEKFDQMISLLQNLDNKTQDGATPSRTGGRE